MKVYLTKDEKGQVIIPEKGFYDLNTGRLMKPNEVFDSSSENSDIKCFELDDALINDVIKKSKALKQAEKDAYDVAHKVHSVLMREHGKQDNERWGGDYSVMCLTLKEDNPLWNYQDLMMFGRTKMSGHLDEIENVCPVETHIKIFAHIGYVYSNGAEKQKSIDIIKKFAQDYKDKNPDLENLILADIKN